MAGTETSPTGSTKTHKNTGKQPAATGNRLILGEALQVARTLDEASFNFIYCDPPFQTGKRRRNVDSNLSFDDRWDSMEEYLGWLKPRVEAMHGLLKPTGCFALHLDWHAVHYAKVLCDEVFGYDRFVNEIVWSFRTGGAGKRALARKHDTILIYGRTGDYAFYPQKEKSYLAHNYGFSNIKLATDEEGTYRMALMRDVWEVPALRGNQPEATGYPTQKPLALLLRLLECFTQPGDLVGDFFMGSGTTALASQTANRRYICGDASPHALEITTNRLDE